MSGYNTKIGGGGFHHIAIKAVDFDKTVEFYTEGLGFSKGISWGEGDKRVIMLDSGDGSFVEVFAGGTPKENKDASIVHMAFRTDNCDVAINNARNAGAVVTREPLNVDIASEPPTPVRIAFCKGPDGEIIEFFQYR